MNIDFVMIVLLAAIAGAVVKIEASKHLTMGYNDYRIENKKQEFDFEKMSQDVSEKQRQGTQNGQTQTVPGAGASCEQ